MICGGWTFQRDSKNCKQYFQKVPLLGFLVTQVHVTFKDSEGVFHHNRSNHCSIKRFNVAARCWCYFEGFIDRDRRVYNFDYRVDVCTIPGKFKEDFFLKKKTYLSLIVEIERYRIFTALIKDPTDINKKIFTKIMAKFSSCLQVQRD